ncbi:hypothetical protein MLD38_026310 [Melastoma candidum]|uniref:Uncharacterized protein n=1 Tax=Melastoma candidum TaxID=119954 RepID=A0ACB9NY25_9MYRT|nr:hypothetical protein MLD38_026310 [Melastoma candidum]
MAFRVVPESPRLTMIVPPMQRTTLLSLTHVNFSPRNTRATKKVNKLDALLRIVFDCKIVYFNERLKVSWARNQNGQTTKLAFATLIRVHCPCLPTSLSPTLCAWFHQTMSSHQDSTQAPDFHLARAELSLLLQ